MKTIKGRFLNRIKSLQSIYPSKPQIVVPITLRCGSPERLSSSQNLQNLQNYIQQEDNANTTLDLVSRKDGHITSSESLMPTTEIDIFEECECEFDDSMPEMVSSSSSPSSNSSPTRENYKDNDEESEGSKELLNLQEICPPGGSDRVILYSTSLRGIRKTFEDCHAIKFLLDSFRVVYYERDVSMHLKYRDELWEVLGGRVVPPRLFIKGRYIGGADEVVMLHEVGMLKNLLQGIPVGDLNSNVKCCQCGGVRFMLCSDCNGSCKVYKGDQGNGGSLFVRCTSCNENGLINCTACSN